MSSDWQPDPSWPPEVQRWLTGFAAYLLTLPPEARQEVMQEVALQMMKSADGKNDVQ